ncbi:MAG: hypothetical protein ACLFUG_08245 [Nitriliruptoraceae bacterium]
MVELVERDGSDILNDRSETEGDGGRTGSVRSSLHASHAILP